MEPREIWTCSEMIRRTEKVCQEAWEEVSLWQPVARKIMGEPMLEDIDKFGILLESMRGHCEQRERKRILKESHVMLLQARRCLIDFVALWATLFVIVAGI